MSSDKSKKAEINDSHECKGQKRISFANCERVLYNYCIIIMNVYVDGDDCESEGLMSRATMIMMIIIMIIMINNNDNDV